MILTHPSLVMQMNIENMAYEIDRERERERESERERTRERTRERE